MDQGFINQEETLQFACFWDQWTNQQKENWFNKDKARIIVFIDLFFVGLFLGPTNEWKILQITIKMTQTANW